MEEDKTSPDNSYISTQQLIQNIDDCINELDGGCVGESLDASQTGFTNKSKTVTSSSESIHQSKTLTLSSESIQLSKTVVSSPEISENNSKTVTSSSESIHQSKTAVSSPNFTENNLETVTVSSEIHDEFESIHQSETAVSSPKLTQNPSNSRLKGSSRSCSLGTEQNSQTFSMNNTQSSQSISEETPQQSQTISTDSPRQSQSLLIETTISSESISTETTNTSPSPSTETANRSLSLPIDPANRSLSLPIETANRSLFDSTEPTNTSLSVSTENPQSSQVCSVDKPQNSLPLFEQDDGDEEEEDDRRRRRKIKLDERDDGEEDDDDDRRRRKTKLDKRDEDDEDDDDGRRRKTKLGKRDDEEEEEEEEEGRRRKKQKMNDGREEDQPVKCESPSIQELEETKPDKLEDDVYTEDSTEYTQYEIVYNFNQQPGQITGAWQDFDNKQQNFLKGCKWSPDGSCVLTNSDDNCLRLFNLPSQIYSGEMDKVPEMKSVLKMKVGETIYDYCWYPLMNSSDPETCCLVSTSRSMPVHMWDAFTGELICSYRSFDEADELVAAHCVTFNPGGGKIYCGFNKTIRVFDVTRPGRDFQKRKTLDKNGGQPGIISCITHSPVDDNLYAAGSYSKTISLYYEPSGEEACQLKGQQGGVTHLIFSPDGTQLFSGGRKDSEILCWDLRNPGKVLLTLDRQVETNQRIYFDMDRSGRYVVSGNQDGTVRVWDILNTETDSRPEPVLSYKAHHDTVNGVSFHPTLPLLSTSSGQRHYPVLGDSDDSDVDDVVQSSHTTDFSLGLWWLG